MAASLLFVGYEIKQSRDIAIADVYQQRAALMVQIQTSSYSTEAYESAWKRQKAGESLSDADKSLIVYVESSPWMTYYENNHFQYELGLLSAEQWEASKRAITVLAKKPGVLEWWGSKRVDFTVSFAEEVDEIFAQQGTTN
ncbi:MAG: hypothetical protein ABJ056_13325 [Halioglobus sp.]